MDTILVFIISLLCGVLSAMGIGGGALLLIYMTIIAGVPQVTAQYINLIYFIPTAVIALIWHIRRKNVDIRAGIISTLFGIGGVFLGAYLAMGVDERLLRRFFGVLLLYIGITQLIKKSPGKDPEKEK